MSQRKIKRDAFRSFQLRKKHTAEHLRNPHPFITAVIDPATKEILCVGTDRERLAQYVAEKGWESFEMKDFAVVI